MLGITDEESAAVVAANQDSIAASIIRAEKFKGWILCKKAGEGVPGNVKNRINVCSKNDLARLAVQLKP